MFSAYSFECFKCDEKSAEECDKKQKKEKCDADETCWKAHFETKYGETGERRGCMKKKECEETKKKCDDDELFDDDGEKLKCAVACCVSDDDKPCNGAFFISTNIVMIMFTNLYSLNLF